MVTVAVENLSMPAPFPLTVQLVSSAVPPLQNRPMLVFPLTVQLVRVVVPVLLYRPSPVFLLTVQLVSVSVPEAILARPPFRVLPLTVQPVSVTVPPLLNRPPPWTASPDPFGARPWVIARPEMDAATPPSIWNTRLTLLPLTVTPAAGPVMVSVPLVLLSSSCVPVSVIVCGVAKTVGSNWMVLVPPRFAWVMQ